MGIFEDIRIKREELKERKTIFKETLKNKGMSVAFGKAKYIGGHPNILAEKAGNIIIKSQGVFFNDTLTIKFIFIPVENILQAEFKTGGQISANPVFSRVLALSGFAFAYKKITKDKYIYLTVTYKENGIESTVLFETESANRFASAITKILQEYTKGKKYVDDKSITVLLKEISELRALGILTEEEFTKKKIELLLKI